MSFTPKGDYLDNPMCNAGQIGQRTAQQRQEGGVK